MHLPDCAFNVGDPFVIENAGTDYRVERSVGKWQRVNIALSNIIKATLTAE